MIQARTSVLSLLGAVQDQQRQFVDLAELCNEGSSIPVAFTKDNRVHIGPKMEMRVVALGLDNAGKTSILFKLKQDEFVSTITTIGENQLIRVSFKGSINCESFQMLQKCFKKNNVFLLPSGQLSLPRSYLPPKPVVTFLAEISRIKKNLDLSLESKTLRYD